MANPSPRRDALQAVRDRAMARLGHGVFQLREIAVDNGWVEVQAWNFSGDKPIDGVEPERYRPIVGDVLIVPVS